MKPGQSLGMLTSRAMAQFDALFEREKDIAAVLIQGDTTTAYTAALSAFYHKIPVGHVEAGLRTSSIREPYPEELNRRMISLIADWHYAPTAQAGQTLLSEKIPSENVLVTGNTGIDALLWSAENQTKPSIPSLRRARG